MNEIKIIATAQATETITISVKLDVASGYYFLTHTLANGTEHWDGASYLTEAEVRKAANSEWSRLRAA
jgi:hypothetical protein